MAAASRDRGELVAFAESRGGSLLSQEFTGMTDPHRWRCALGHEFEATPRLLVHGGYWCPECFPAPHEGRGWDWESQAQVDPLLARFHRKG
jgi:hypothetical protein